MAETPDREARLEEIRRKQERADDLLIPTHDYEYDVDWLLSEIDRLKAELHGPKRQAISPQEANRLAHENDHLKAKLEGEGEPDIRSALELLDAAVVHLTRALRRRDLEGIGQPIGEIQLAMECLRGEPPAEPDLDELTPRCPACEETIHDCECNPYMGSGEDET